MQQPHTTELICFIHGQGLITRIFLDKTVFGSSWLLYTQILGIG